jgi:hypothetical protein
LPFLRFARDKRGYETTLLVHSGRRHGRSQQRILYWFRTPPGVKIGRPALDQEAIRWIEEHNPDIEFEWPKILEAQPPAAPPAEDTRARRVRRDRDRAKPPRSARPLPPPPSTRQVEPVEPEPSEAPEGHAELEPEAEPSIVAQAFEQLTHPEAEERDDPVAMPLDRRVGPEELTRLRARYAELLARIAERGGTAERIEALRAQAESLNPDTWLTDEDVRQGIESFESRIRDLRSALGLRRRRRSRRGGRRRRGEGENGAVPADGPGQSSDEAGQSSDDEE